MKLLLINGPMGSGKSWTTERLREAYSHVVWTQVSFKAPLAKATQELLGVPEMNYERFKTMIFYEASGREWMIRLGNMARSHYIDIFVKAALSRATSLQITGKKQIFFCDDLGFENEVLVPRSVEQVQVLTATIEPPGGVGRGEQYLGDSRFNLAHHANLIAENSTDMLTAICKSLENRGWV